MSTQEQMGVLLIERKLSHKLFFFQGSYIYPLIKQELLLPGLSEQREQYPGNKRNLDQKIKTVISVLGKLTSLLFQPTLKPHDLLFVDSSSSRRYVEDGISFSVYCDFLINKLAAKAKTSLLLELPSVPSKRHEKIATPYIYYPDLDFIRIFIASLFARRRYKETEPIVNELKTYGIQVSSKKVNRLLKRYALYSRWAEKVLKRIRPEQLIVVCSYTYLHMALIRAGKRRNIPVIELQHGQMSAQHYGYMYSHLEKRDLTPDFFFAYGKYYSDLLKQNSVLFEPGSIFETGNLFLEEVSKKDTGLLNDLMKRAGKRDIVLISSQNATREGLKGMVSSLITANSEKLFFIYKPHPAETDAAAYYANLKGKQNCYLVLDNQYSTIDLLRIAKAHITVYSTVFMEAYYFRVPTVFYFMEFYSENVLQFINNSFYYMGRDSAEILETLEKLPGKKSDEVGDEFEFYSSDPWGRFYTALNALA